MQDLFRRYIDNQCTAEEVKELLAYFNVPENEVVLRALITESLEFADADLEEDGNEWSHLTDESFAMIKKQINADRAKLVPIPIYRKAWFRIAAAAVLLVGAFGVYTAMNSDKQKPEIVKAQELKQVGDPGSNKAVLILADGSAIILENIENGAVTDQGETKIEKPADGQLAYNSLNEKPTEVLFNSIMTPRGGQYQLTLSDGTKVWLNAASSLRYPAAFTGNERRVELAGEAYFEVAKNASMPFKVSVSGKAEVVVLGTQFNVNAYSDEATVNTTLLEGSVKIMVPASREPRILTPGEQAQLHSNGEITVDKNVEQAMTWRNGTFTFVQADLGRVFRQLSRWYDVDLEFEGPLPERQFSGEIQRDLKLSQVLRLLERNNVFCRIEGKKLIVLKS